MNTKIKNLILWQLKSYGYSYFSFNLLHFNFARNP